MTARITTSGRCNRSCSRWARRDRGRDSVPSCRAERRTWRWRPGDSLRSSYTRGAWDRAWWRGARRAARAASCARASRRMGGGRGDRNFNGAGLSTAGGPPRRGRGVESRREGPASAGARRGMIAGTAAARGARGYDAAAQRGLTVLAADERAKVARCAREAVTARSRSWR